MQRVVRFLRSYVCNKLRRMSRRESFDSPRLQLMESKWVRNTGEGDAPLSAIAMASGISGSKRGTGQALLRSNEVTRKVGANYRNLVV